MLSLSGRTRYAKRRLRATAYREPICRSIGNQSADRSGLRLARHPSENRPRELENRYAQRPRGQRRMKVIEVYI